MTPRPQLDESVTRFRPLDFVWGRAEGTWGIVVDAVDPDEDEDEDDESWGEALPRLKPRLVCSATFPEPGKVVEFRAGSIEQLSLLLDPLEVLEDVRRVVERDARRPRGARVVKAWPAYSTDAAPRLCRLAEVLDRWGLPLVRHGPLGALIRLADACYATGIMPCNPSEHLARLRDLGGRAHPLFRLIAEAGQADLAEAASRRVADERALLEQGIAKGLAKSSTPKAVKKLRLDMKARVLGLTRLFGPLAKTEVEELGRFASEEIDRLLAELERP